MAGSIFDRDRMEVPSGADSVKGAVVGYVSPALRALREDRRVLTRVEPRITSSLMEMEFFLFTGKKPSGEDERIF